MRSIEEIKKVVGDFYEHFLQRFGSQEVAIELTKEAMTTYRTLLIQNGKEQQKEERLTEHQLQFLEWKKGDFKTGEIIQQELQKIGKKDIKELTKQEASQIIAKVKGGEK